MLNLNQTRSGDKLPLQKRIFCGLFLSVRNPEILKSVSYEVVKISLLKCIRPPPNGLFNVCDSLGIKLLTRLLSGLSHVREYKFRILN